MAMDITRLLNQNVYYYVVSGLAHGVQDWSNTQVLMGVPADTSNVAIPSIAINSERTQKTPLELDTLDENRIDPYLLSVFAKRDGQRDDLGEYVKNFFVDTTKQFLDFNDGFPPTGGQNVLGLIRFSFINIHSNVY
jgi:hypothetical protein